MNDIMNTWKATHVITHIHNGRHVNYRVMLLEDGKSAICHWEFRAGDLPEWEFVDFGVVNRYLPPGVTLAHDLQDVIFCKEV